ncbi:molybdopterin dinucleotide binding domain-containing protein, partial [Klebsiella sp. 2HUBk32mer]|uniref:molybdopterin dinucleotide binding domain-containing protein n=1 Tax=Klebsiella sp. 2HUBk32mer TaxID=3391023 RepID=UPI0039838AAB
TGDLFYIMQSALLALCIYYCLSVQKKSPRYIQAACRQEVWLNPLDAEKRGIKNGDMVRVFNQRGEVRLPAKVTPRIMPGVSAMGQGAWHDANMAGDRIDHGACMNTLTTHRPSPLAKGNPQHTNLVDIEKV